MRKYYLTNCLLFFVLLWLFFSCSEHLNTNSIIGKPVSLKEPTSLKWIGHWKGEGLKEQLLKDIAREFEFVNQDIRVDLQFPEDVYYKVGTRGDNSYETNFNAEQLTGNNSEWDIIRINHDSSLRVNLKDPKWARNYLVDVSTYPEINNGLIPSVTSDKYKAGWAGILPGPPLDASNYVLFCNTEVAKEVGIDVKQFDMSFDDFLTYLKAVLDYNKRNNKNIIAIMDNSDWSCLDIIAQQLFCSEIGDYGELTSDKYSKDKEAALKKVIASMMEMGAYNPLPVDISKHIWSKSNEIILNNQCLFYPQGSWMYNIWRGIDSIKYKKIIPVQLPGYKKAQTYLGEYRVTWAIPKNSSHKEEALRMMKFICKPGIADKWVRYTKSPTGIKGSIVSTTMGFDAYENFDYYITSNFKNTKIARLITSTFYLGSKNNSYNFNFNGIINNNPVELNKLNNFLRNIKR